MEIVDKQTRINEAEKFFNLIFGNVTERKFGYLWTKQDKATYPFTVSTDERKAMATKAIELADMGFDVYCGVNLMDEPAAKNKRVKAEHVTLQTATVTDIDIEGGNHISTDKKLYPPNCDVAKSFLPFTVSFLVDSGFGLHGYCLYSEPITITAENRDACTMRNKKFIDATRRRAGVFSGAVDGVGDLPRVLRVPGTFNYKCGRENAPLCKLVEVTDIRFTPADMDERLNALTPQQETKQKEPPPMKAKVVPINTTANPTEKPSEQERAIAMLDVIPCSQQTYEDWFYTGVILFNTGNDISDWIQWSRADKRFKDGECEKKWRTMHKGTLTIATLHKLAKFYGYSEKDFQRDWYAQHGGSCRITHRPKRDERIDPLFHGGASDLAFAKRMEKFCGDRVKWCNEATRWYRYSGGVWTADSGESSAVSPFAVELADILEKHATNDAEHKLAASFQSSKKIGSAINLLKARHSVRITLADLDNHAELLNCLNGCVDLTNGKLLEADPELLFTRQANAIYRPSYRNELVEKFLRDILPDEPTREAVIRFLGYALFGLIRDHVAHFWRGDGRNGKSTLINLILELLNTYAVKLPTSAFLYSGKPSDPNAATPSLNAIEGARLAICNELPRNAILDSATFKTVTGGDEIAIRPLHCEFKKIKPCAKIIINGNFLPELDPTADFGLQERLRNVPFTQTFTGDRADPRLMEKLLTPDALSGMLSLLVDAAKMWNKDGLLESEAMKAAKRAYVADNNFIGEFLDEYCKFGADLSIPRKELLARLKEEYPAECLRQFSNSDRALSDAIRRIPGIGYRRGGKDGGRKFYGVGWASAKENKQSNPYGGEPVDPDDMPL